MAAAVRIADKTDEQLDQLAKRWKMSKKDVVGSMSSYMIKHNIDARRDAMADPGKEYQKLRQTVVSFIREQESRYLNPTREAVQLLVQKVNMIDEDQKAKAFKKKLEGDRLGLSNLIYRRLLILLKPDHQKHESRLRWSRTTADELINYANSR